MYIIYIYLFNFIYIFNLCIYYIAFMHKICECQINHDIQ